jgi:hypothetical protein
MLPHLSYAMSCGRTEGRIHARRHSLLYAKILKLSNREAAGDFGTFGGKVGVSISMALAGQFCFSEEKTAISCQFSVLSLVVGM